NGIVISRRQNVPASGFGDSHVRSLDFHLPIIESDALAVIRSSHFHPYKIVRVIDDSHLVGFSVAGSKSSFADMRCRFRLRILAHQRAQGGVPRDRKAWMPA